MLEFAITFKPDMPPERIVHLTKQAEHNGFAYGWIFDCTSCGRSHTRC